MKKIVDHFSSWVRVSPDRSHHGRDKNKKPKRKMKLTKTQTAMMLKLAGKIKTTPYTCNHENAALAALRSKKLAEYFYFQNNVGTCCGTRLTEAGQKFAEAL